MTWPAMPALPNDDTALYHWIFALMILHLGASYAIRWLRTNDLFSDHGLTVLLPRIFDAATFAASIMLCLGIMDDDVLKAIGSTKPFLLVGGFGGALYGVHALFPKI